MELLCLGLGFFSAPFSIAVNAAKIAIVLFQKYLLICILQVTVIHS